MSKKTVKSELAVIGSSGDLSTSITSFENHMHGHVSALGLPNQSVLIDIPDRVSVLSNMGAAIKQLPDDYRSKSMYLSKFAFAVSAGLFDAALNYLWDETIGELRRRIVDYDLSYFFDLAVSDPEKRKDLVSPEDLIKLTDDELIRAAATVGFISIIGHRQLDVVRFMRNHASAAHPNQHELKPYQLLGYVETCIAEVIMLPESQTMVDTSRLLRNVRDAKVSKADAAAYAVVFQNLRDDQVTALANGLFGIYVRTDSATRARDNIRLLLPYLWPHVAERTRAAFGVKFGRFKANMDYEQAGLARELLETVGGAASYLPDDQRAVEIDSLAADLLSAHEGMNNFYNEPPVARKLRDYVGEQPVPVGVREKYVATLVDVYLGRRSGISGAADPIYADLIGKFAPDEAALALIEVTGPNLAGTLAFGSPQEQLGQMLDILQPKLIGEPAVALDKAVRKFTGPKDSMILDTGIQAKRKLLRQFIA